MKYCEIPDEEITKILLKQGDIVGEAAAQYITELRWALGKLHGIFSSFPSSLCDVMDNDDWIRYCRAYYGYHDDDPIDEDEE